MEEAIKDRIILVLAILAIILFVGTVGSCMNVRQYKSGRVEEIAKRLDAEEKLSKTAQEKTRIEERLKAEADGLESEKAAHEKTKNALAQEKLVTQSLKEELQKVTQLKEALEKDLKEALVSGKPK